MDQLTNDDIYGSFLRSNDLEASYENAAQLQVFVKAMAIYQSRTQDYGTAWKEYGAMNNLVRLGSKVKRLVVSFWGKPIPKPEDLPKLLDDAYDVMNYAAFTIRQAENDQWWSEEPVERY